MRNQLIDGYLYGREQEFMDWLKTIPPTHKFNMFSCSKCVLGDFLQEQGFDGVWIGLNHYSYHTETEMYSVPLPQWAYKLQHGEHKRLYKQNTCRLKTKTLIRELQHILEMTQCAN